MLCPCMALLPGSDPELLRRCIFPQWKFFTDACCANPRLTSLGFSQSFLHLVVQLVTKE